ncbi:MAG: HAD-IA family hydrolase [bacterium]|jgi:glucose-1-phosphatase
MKNSDIETIIFDFGGVILDIDPQLTMNEFARMGARKLDADQTNELIYQIVRKFEKGIYTPEVFRETMKDFLQLKKIQDQEFDDAWNALLYDIPAKRIKAIEESKDHYQIFLLSNSNEIHYDLYVRDLQLRFGYREFDELFDKAYFSFDLHMAKPESEIFEFVIYQHDLNPAKTLFIDDMDVNLATAKKLGLCTYKMQKPEKVRHLFEEGKLKDEVKIVWPDGK